MKLRHSTPVRLIFSALFLFLISHTSVLGQGRWENYSREEALLNPATLCLFGDSNGNSGQYPYFWTGTTHLDGANPYASGVYIAFGEGMGEMNGTLMDVHGAGCQRSDPKSGDQSSYPQFWGPQGDVRYVYNYVRCVRDIKEWKPVYRPT